MKAIVRYERWYWRSKSNAVGCCKLETWRDAAGGYHVLVTERGDNPGPSVTNDHAVLREALEKWLEIPDGMPYCFWEQYDEESYRPPRDREWREICSVTLSTRGPHWRYVPDDEWQEIYINPRLPRPIVKVRKAKTT